MKGTALWVMAMTLEMRLGEAVERSWEMAFGSFLKCCSSNSCILWGHRLEYTWSKGKFTQHYSREMRKWLTSKYLSKGTFSKQTSCYDAERWKSKFIKKMLWLNWQNLCSVNFISIKNCVNSKWKKKKKECYDKT